MLSQFDPSPPLPSGMGTDFFFKLNLGVVLFVDPVRYGILKRSSGSHHALTEMPLPAGENSNLFATSPQCVVRILANSGIRMGLFVGSVMGPITPVKMPV